LSSYGNGSDHDTEKKKRKVGIGSLSQTNGQYPHLLPFGLRKAPAWGREGGGKEDGDWAWRGKKR